MLPSPAPNCGEIYRINLHLALGVLRPFASHQYFRWDDREGPLVADRRYAYLVISSPLTIDSS